MEISIHIPAIDHTPINDMLRVITEALVKKTGKWVGNILGGEFGYGSEWNTDVFQMHPYCWCDDVVDCPWCAGCSCGNQIYFSKRKENPKVTCDFCENVHKFSEQGALSPAETPHLGAPHFWHKPSGLKVWWYKYIGRSMTYINVPTDISSILNDCLEDVNNAIVDKT